MYLLLSPLTWVWLALLLWAAGHHWRRRWLRRMAMALGLLAAATMTPLVANALVGAIEQRADAGPEDHCERADALVVLSAGLGRTPRNASDHGSLSDISLARLFELIERPPNAGMPLIISGGGPHPIPEAQLLATLLELLDPRFEPTLENRSRTTWESALEVAKMLPPPRHIALASSALHLPRARLAFEAAGFSVCRRPLDRRHVAVGGIGAVTPQTSSLRKTEAAMHELVGEAYYRFRARYRKEET